MTPAAPRAGRPVWQTPALIALGVLVAFGLAWFVARLPGSGTDYYFTFRPLALNWLAGRTRLYDGTVSLGFYDPPWAITWIALFAALPYQPGLVGLLASTVLMLAAGALVFSVAGRARPWALAFALFNFHTFDLLFRGQLNGLEVAGVALGWLACQRRRPWLMGLAYLALMMIPPNTIPVALFLAWITWRDWPRRQWIISFTIPVGVLLASFVFFGWWPPRWVANDLASPQQIFFLTTIWRMADQLSLPLAVPVIIALGVLALTVWAWRRAGTIGHQAGDLARLMLVIAATLMITPYSLSYRLILLVACVMPFLAAWRLDMLVGLYLLTFLPLTRLLIGRDNAWIDIVFVTAVFAAVLVAISQRAGQTAVSRDLTRDG